MVGQGPGKVSVMELTKEEGDSTHSRNTSFCIMAPFGLYKAHQMDVSSFQLMVVINDIILKRKQ